MTTQSKVGFFGVGVLAGFGAVAISYHAGLLLLKLAIVHTVLQAMVQS